MRPDHSRRAGRLSQLLPAAVDVAAQDPELTLDAFRRTRVERTAACLRVAMRIALVAVAAAAVAMLVAALVDRGGHSASRQVGDARWSRDYRDAPGAALARLDDRNLLLATRGQGLQLLRTDAGTFGIWRALDISSRLGTISGGDLQDVKVSPTRSYVLGADGVLSSFSRALDDFHVHFGGRGFSPWLNLDNQVNDLSWSNDRTFFVIGTAAHGAAAYDLLTRQWTTLDAAGGDLPSDNVNAVAMVGDALWVGTDAGLSVLGPTREVGGLMFHRSPIGALPGPYDKEPVRVLRPNGTHTMECVAGNGAHLSFQNYAMKWDVRVGDAEPDLVSSSGRLELTTALPIADRILFAWADKGPASYNPNLRRLELLRDGLPKGAMATALLPRFAGGAPEAWLLATVENQQQLFRLVGSTWSKASFPPVKTASFAGRDAIALLTDGELAASDGPGDLHPFAVGVDSIPTGCADADDGSLVVAGAHGDVRYYSADHRGWRHLIGRGDSPIRQLRLAAGKALVVGDDGSLGHYDLGTGTYGSDGGTTDLGRTSLPVTAAAVRGSNLYFVRGGRLYVYAATDRSIRRFLVAAPPPPPPAPSLSSPPKIPWYDPYDYLEKTRKQIRTKRPRLVPLLIPKAGPVLPKGPSNDLLRKYLHEIEEKNGRKSPPSGSLEGPGTAPKQGDALPEHSARARGEVPRARRAGNAHPSASTSDGDDLPVPLDLAATNARVYFSAWVGNAGPFLYRTTGTGWERQLDDPIKSFYTTPDALVAHAGTSVSIAVDGKDDRTLLSGSGTRNWAVLEGDRFGNLWGIDDRGAFRGYLRETGSWTYLDTSAGASHHDLALVSDGLKAAVTTFVGTPKGLVSWSWDPGRELKRSREIMSGVDVREVRVQGGRVWALVGDPLNQELLNLELRSTDLGGSDSETHWKRAGRLPKSVGNAEWARFVGDELWLVLAGTFWRYGLDQPVWSSAELSSKWSRLEIENGHIWWLGDANGLHTLDVKSGIPSLVQLGPGDLNSLRESLERADRIRSTMLYLAGWLFVIGVLLLVLRALLDVLRRRRSRPFTSRVLRSWFLWGAALSALVSGVQFVRGVSLSREIAERRPFDRSFAGLLDYELTDDELHVYCTEGLYVFARGRSLTPSTFHPGMASKPRADAPPTTTVSRKGDWKLAWDRARWRLERSINGKWIAIEPGSSSGFAIDDWRSFVVSGDRVLAETGAGILELAKANGKGPELVPTDLRRVPKTARLRALRGDVFLLGSDQADASLERYRGPATWEAVESLPRLSAVDVSWRREAKGDVLDDRSFDGERFARDAVVALEPVGSDALPLVKTRAGWRKLELAPGAAPIGPPLATLPVPLDPVRRMRVARWNVTVTPRDAGNNVLFSLDGARSWGADPFQDRGRLPDEDVAAVLGEGKERDAWRATRAGLYAPKPYPDLLGHRAIGVAREGSVIWARTEDGDYSLRGRAWTSETAPDSVFPSVRRLSVPLGGGLSVGAIERSERGKTATELVEFDRERMRFQHDVIHDVVGDLGGTTADFLIETSTGVQRMRLEAGKLKTVAHFFDGELPVLRRDASGSVWAATKDGHLRWEEGRKRWTADGAGDPFEELTGSVGELLTWHRGFGPRGDTWRILTSQNEPVALVQGKLQIDQVTDLAIGRSGDVIEVTAGGIIRGAPPIPLSFRDKKSLIALPPDGGRVALDGDGAVALGGRQALRYDPAGESWVPTSTRAFDRPAAAFDGQRWMPLNVDPLKERRRVVWSGGGPLVLDRQGRLPSDVVGALAVLDDDLWMTSGRLLTVTSARDLAPEHSWILPDTANPTPRLATLPDRRVLLRWGDAVLVSSGAKPYAPLLPAKDIPFPVGYWVDHKGGATLSVTRKDERAVTARASNGREATILLPDGMLAAEGDQDTAWILTKGGLQRWLLPRL